MFEISSWRIPATLTPIIIIAAAMQPMLLLHRGCNVFSVCGPTITLKDRRCLPFLKAELLRLETTAVAGSGCSVPYNNCSASGRHMLERPSGP